MEIIRGLPESVYRARPERSQSDFKQFLKPTPAHAKHAIDNKKESTESMVIGTCLHALVLENKVVYAVAPEGDKRTTAFKKELADFTEANKDKLIISKEDAAAVEGMAAGIKRNSGAMAMLEASTDREVSIFWNNMKARLDLVFPLGGIDIKSCQTAELYEFSKAILRYGLHIQAAHYLEALAVAGLPCEDFYIIAVENTLPNEAAIYKIGHESLEIGRRELDELKRLYCECEASGNYPGYSHEPVEIDLPAWALRKERNF